VGSAETLYYTPTYRDMQQLQRRASAKESCLCLLCWAVVQQLSTGVERSGRSGCKQGCMHADSEFPERATV
jgi:hypothetical protein